MSWHTHSFLSLEQSARRALPGVGQREALQYLQALEHRMRAAVRELNDMGLVMRAVPGGQVEVEITVYDAPMPVFMAEAEGVSATGVCCSRRRVALRRWAVRDAVAVPYHGARPLYWLLHDLGWHDVGVPRWLHANAKRNPSMREIREAWMQDKMFKLQDAGRWPDPFAYRRTRDYLRERERLLRGLRRTLRRTPKRQLKAWWRRTWGLPAQPWAHVLLHPAMFMVAGIDREARPVTAYVQEPYGTLIRAISQTIMLAAAARSDGGYRP